MTHELAHNQICHVNKNNDDYLDAIAEYNPDEDYLIDQRGQKFHTRFGRSLLSVRGKKMVAVLDAYQHALTRKVFPCFFFCDNAGFVYLVPDAEMDVAREFLTERIDNAQDSDDCVAQPDNGGSVAERVLRRFTNKR